MHVWATDFLQRMEKSTRCIEHFFFHLFGVEQSAIKSQKQMNKNPDFQSIAFIIAKFNSKEITDLNVTPKTIQEENIGEKFCEPWLGKDFLDAIPCIVYKIKISKLNFSKIKNLCFSKDTARTMRKQITDWERYLQSMYLIKDLHSEYKKNLKTQK